MEKWNASFIARGRTIDHRPFGQDQTDVILRSAAAAWTEEEDEGAGPAGMQFLMRQVACIGGGTTEIARNVISERVLGMPCELSGDRNVTYRDIPRGPKRG